MISLYETAVDRCKACWHAVHHTHYPGFGIHIVRCSNPFCAHSWPTWARKD